MYDSLIQNTHLIATIIFGLAIIYLLVGLISPAWAAASGRGTVVLRSILGVLLAIGLAVGVIVYTHMQPDGPHAVEGYIKNHDWEQYRTSKPEEAPPPAPAQ
ncbi:hypothetical protein [Hyphomicrobium sp. NDB2Meth4]|uniref:hypothetical protein n=1 Tax=Hyphomicrobium sp. NDB2Meth4 TaxID=1892846 RepID=UPI00093164A9|nr:hypothetical protein [Hyphomicrobium sp. NDB2Meth4]